MYESAKKMRTEARIFHGKPRSFAQINNFSASKLFSTAEFSCYSEKKGSSSVEKNTTKPSIRGIIYSILGNLWFILHFFRDSRSVYEVYWLYFQAYLSTCCQRHLLFSLARSFGPLMRSNTQKFKSELSSEFLSNFSPRFSFTALDRYSDEIDHLIERSTNSIIVN